MPQISDNTGRRFVRQPWADVFPWLNGYVSRRAAILEGLAPDLDWWFGQTPAQTAADTDIDSLCEELARIFVARHSNEHLGNAFPGIPDTITTIDLPLGQRAQAALASLSGYTQESLTDIPASATLLQFTASELRAAPGLGNGTVEQIIDALIRVSVLATSPDSSTCTGQFETAGCASIYREAPTTPLGVPEDLDRIRSRPTSSAIDLAISEIVAIEGPVSIDRLARTIVHRFGFERASPRRQDQIKRKVPRERVHRSRLGVFVWPEEINPVTWRSFRTTPPGTDRPLEDIAPEEIANAMQSLAQHTVSRDELFRTTLATFGFSRLTKQATLRLDCCLLDLLQSERIESNGVSYRSTSAP